MKITNGSFQTRDLKISEASVHGNFIVLKLILIWHNYYYLYINTFKLEK